jgi:hypothetical protein
VDFEHPAFKPLTEAESTGMNFQAIAGALSNKDLIPGTVKDFEANTKKMDVMFGALIRYADGMADISTRLSAEKVSAVEERVKSLVEHAGKMNAILNDLGNIELNATIDALEKNMKVAKSTFEVKGGAVQVNVQLNVTMNAEKLAGQMVLDGYLAPSTEFGQYLQKDTNTTFDGISADNKKLYYTSNGIPKQARE